jgi:hypothetical protein
MKTKQLLSLTLIFTTFIASAQIPNSGFEDWTVNDPNSWVTTNGLMALGNPQSVFKSTDAYSGSSACEINTVRMTNRPPGVFVPEYAGSVFIGKQVFVTSIAGFPYTNQPSLFSMWYKFSSPNGDTASVLVMTTKWNSTNNKRDTISIGTNIIKDTVSVYTKLNAQFFVLDTINQPDTAVIYISSSSLTASNAGAKLIVDDLTFSGGNVGINDTKEKVVFSVYPNPTTNGRVFIQSNDILESPIITLMDLQGKVIWQKQMETDQNFIIDSNQLLKGLYFIQVKNQKGTATNKIIFE